jgi:hypothetical protein
VEPVGQIRDRGVGTSELLQNAAPGGVRERGERGIEPSLRILNHTVQYTLHESANASAFDEFETDIRENKIVPHSSRERPGDVKERQNGRSFGSAVRGPDCCIAAGSETELENTLKVETGEGSTPTPVSGRERCSTDPRSRRPMTWWRPSRTKRGSACRPRRTSWSTATPARTWSDVCPPGRTYLIAMEASSASICLPVSVVGFSEPGRSSNCGSSFGSRILGAEQVQQLWILDLGGVPLVIEALLDAGTAGTSSQVQAELLQMVESVQIDPR